MRPAYVLFCVFTAAACRSGGSRTSHVEAPRAVLEPPAFGAETIDDMLRTEWASRGIVPAGRSDDPTFLRRVYLDVVGRIPTLEEIRAAMLDTSPDRRARIIDDLLASPAYADRWTDYWDDVLLGDYVRPNVVDRAGFRAFLHARLASQTPWNRLVFDLVTATGVNRQGGPEPTGRDEAAPFGATHAAVNWILKYQNNPADMAGSVSRTFLGVRIQCAQCHDHKTEDWKQRDYQSFASCFAGTRTVRLDSESGGGRAPRIAVLDAHRRKPSAAREPELVEILRAPPTALDGTDLSDTANPREAVAAWITSAQNPWFAKAIVNRLWGELLGRGFVDPIDDFRVSNPALAPAVMERLAAEFVARGYDLRYLIGTICRTEAYQKSSEPALPYQVEPAFWSRFPLKPLRPEVLLDSLAVATDLDELLTGTKDGDLAKAKAQLRKQFQATFDVDEESHAASYEGTIPQALMFMNGRPLDRATHAGRQGALLKVLSMTGSDEEKVDNLFLRTLSRPAKPEETKRILPRLAQRGTSRLDAFEDVMWALLNSSEFAFNH